MWRLWSFYANLVFFLFFSFVSENLTRRSANPLKHEKIYSINFFHLISPSIKKISFKICSSFKIMAHDSFTRFIYNELLREEPNSDKHSESMVISHEHTGKLKFAKNSKYLIYLMKNLRDSREIHWWNDRKCKRKNKKNCNFRLFLS